MNRLHWDWDEAGGDTAASRLGRGEETFTERRKHDPDDWELCLQAATLNRQPQSQQEFLITNFIEPR